MGVEPKRAAFSIKEAGCHLLRSFRGNVIKRKGNSTGRNIFRMFEIFGYSSARPKDLMAAKRMKVMKNSICHLLYRRRDAYNNSNII